MMDVWSLVMFIVPLLIILTHTFVHVIDQKHLAKEEKYAFIRTGLMLFGQIVIPTLVLIFIAGFFVAGELHMSQF